MIHSLPSKTTASVLKFGERTKSLKEWVVPVEIMSKVSLEPDPASLADIEAPGSPPAMEMVARLVRGSNRRQIKKATRGDVTCLFI
jgi:hypothetical protein